MMNDPVPLSPGSVSTVAPDGRRGADVELRYRVFLSYSHSDTRWATWLMHRLEGYRVPRRFHGRAAPIGQVGARLAPVYRDRDELPTASDLGATIRAALARSATLVVICSPAAAKSHWVGEEIREFKRLHGPDRVFAFIVAGKPDATSEEDCFSPALREAGTRATHSEQPTEIAAADARPHGDGRDMAFVRLVAGLLGVGVDDVRQREVQRRHRRMTIITTSSLIGMSITLGLALVAWQARNDARRRQEQAEDLLGFMVSDLRAPLAKLNKLELLDDVGRKAMHYFGSLDPRDLTDTALRRQVEAMRQIGQNRQDQGRYAEALQSLQPAYESARILSARHPKNGELLFERAQVEFWIGSVLRRLGRLAEMTEWLTRYRDSAAALVALNPADPRWQEELASGHHNLAVMDADEERLDSARRGFLGELALLEQLVRARPADLALQFRIVDVNSWLGSVAEMTGDFGEAASRFAEQVARTELILRAEPGNARWKGRLADALSLHSGILGITGRVPEALDCRRRGKALLESLAAGDPQNHTWLRLLLWVRSKEAELLQAQGDLQTAARLVDEVREKFEKLLAAEPKDQRMQERLSFAYRLQAELRSALGGADASESAARAVEIAERLLQSRQTYTYVNACAHAHLTAGVIADRRGDREIAQKHWRRALEILEPRLAGSNHWRILHPAAEAYRRLGRLTESNRLSERLERLGFKPLAPWPGAVAAAPLSQQLQP